MCPCIQDPTLRARGISDQSDLTLFARCIERCRQFDIAIVWLPCLETIHCGRDREPASFSGRLNTEDFFLLMEEHVSLVEDQIERRGKPLAIIGVDSSPTCGVNTTYSGPEKQPKRGAFLARFPDIPAFDVGEFARYRVYLAAPLFSEAEQSYNREIFNFLTKHLFSVYLPQDVGDTSHSRKKEDHQNIFRQHTAALDACDYVVAIVDGADADSGTSWEMGYAYARGIPVIALRTDFRRAGEYERVNLMLEESSRIITTREDLPHLLKSPLVSRAAIPGSDHFPGR